MPQYIGFSTQQSCKPPTRNAVAGSGNGFGSLLEPISVGRKFKITDQQLVINDFINALNIRQGEKVGQPAYGTTLWDFVFEPNTQDMQFLLETEIRRVGALDPRLNIEFVKAYPKENGILMEVQASVLPFNQSMILSVFFDSMTNTAQARS